MQSLFQEMMRPIKNQDILLLKQREERVPHMHRLGICFGSFCLFIHQLFFQDPSIALDVCNC